MITFDYLLPKTKEILTEISQHKVFSDFTFVGGSALSCFLSHRLSEDLDFFTWENHLDTERLLPIFNREDLQVINRSHQQTDLIYKGVKITFFLQQMGTVENFKISSNRSNSNCFPAFIGCNESEYPISSCQVPGLLRFVLHCK